MYTPIAQRQNKPVKGYTPIAQRTKPAPSLFTGFDSPLPPYKIARSTDATLIDKQGGTLMKTVGGFARDVGQGIARNIGSAGITVASKINKNIEPLKSEDIKSFFGQALFENVFGKGEEIKSIEQRVAEAEPKIKAWQEELQKTLETPGLNTREKFVVKLLANMDVPTLAFTGVMGSVGLDLTPFGGLEKNAFKQITKVKTIGEGLQVGRKLGIADDLLENFAKSAVKVANDTDAEKLFKSFANLQQTTKAKPAYTSVAQRTTPETASQAFRTTNIQGNTLEQQLARKATELEIKSPTAKSRGYQSIPDKAGYEKVFKPYGESGAGYYYSKKVTVPLEKINARQVELYQQLDGATRARRIKINIELDRLANEERKITAVTPPQRAIKPREGLPRIKPELKIKNETRINELKTEIQISEEALSDNPARKLARYINKRTGEVPEALGQRGGKFKQFGDDISSMLEFEDSETARLAYEKYSKSRQILGQLKQELKNVKKDTFEDYSPKQLERINRLLDEVEKTGIKKQLPTPEGLPKITATGQKTSGTLSIKDIGVRKTLTQAGTAKLPFRPVSKGIATQSTQEIKTISLKDSVAQKTTVGKGGTIADETYTANRVKLSEKTSKMTRAKDKLTAGLNSLREGTDKILGTISTRLKNIDLSLKTSIRTFEYKLANATQKDRKAVEPFLKAIRKNIDSADYADLDLALKNGDTTKVNQVIKKYGLEEEFKTVQATLDDLYKRAKEVGYDIGYEKDYFPRMVEDSEGLLEYFQKGDDWSIIEEAIRAKETDLGRYLTVKEKANTINTLIRGYSQGKITLSKTGAMKARKIDFVDAELNQFYHDSVATLSRYVDETNNAIEARRFFGKGNRTDQFANVDDSIGAYILDLMAKGKVKPSQEKELRDILRARFNEVGTSGVVRVYKNLSYIDTMGSVISAITQLGDLAFAIYKGGLIRSIGAFSRALVGKSLITRADIGILKIAQEFQDSSTSANAVNKVFKIIGLEKMDALGKETVINATIGKYRKLAEEPTTTFLKKLDAIFGDNPENISMVIDDLKAGKVTEDVKLIAFNELLDVQPVALSEMPEQYLKGGNGRIFYMLKTYTIKLFDVYRNEVFHEIASGNKVQGIKNLIKLTSALLLMNATADEIKDLILNRETSLKDRTVDNILKLVGFSKFTIYKAREEGIGSAVAKTILPPFKFIDSSYKDITQSNEISQLETIQSIPIGGKLYYWWFGKGATNTEKKRKSAEPQSKKLKTPPGLPELPSLKNKLPTPPGLPKL